MFGSTNERGKPDPRTGYTARRRRSLLVRTIQHSPFNIEHSVPPHPPLTQRHPIASGVVDLPRLAFKGTAQ
jgi:hypothetical protein